MVPLPRVSFLDFIARPCCPTKTVPESLSLDQHFLARSQVVQACVAERIERGVELFLALDPTREVGPDVDLDQARAFLGTLPAEVRSVIENDPALQTKLASLAKDAVTTELGAMTEPAPEPYAHNSAE